MMTIVLAVLSLAAPLDQTGSGGTAAETTASIRGRVMRDDGQPLARAVVSLVIEDVVNGVRTTARTDETGGYVLTKLEAGEYRVSAAKTGYSTREFGQRHAFEHGDVIVLSARERRDHVDIALSRSAAVEGRIVDENNEPIDRTTMSALQVRYKGGRRQLVAVPGVLPRRTNELGRYRVYGLPPGDYFISAEAAARGDNEPAEYATTYFPGAALPEAARVVRVGFEDVAGVDFALAPVTTCRITGRTITSAGVPCQGGIQMRPSRRSGAIAADEVGARSLPDGSFEFTNVAPGEYVLYAFSSVEVAWRYVTVAGTDVSGVEMQTMPGSHITGRVTFEGPDVPAPQDIGLTPVPANPDFAPFVGVANHA